MNDYYFTFGQRYATEAHPAGGHPDGWFKITAPTMTDARVLMQSIAGKKWAACYDGEPDLKTFPRGELKRFVFSSSVEAAQSSGSLPENNKVRDGTGEESQ